MYQFLFLQHIDVIVLMPWSVVLCSYLDMQSMRLHFLIFLLNIFYALILIGRITRTSVTGVGSIYKRCPLWNFTPYRMKINMGVMSQSSLTTNQIWRLFTPKTQNLPSVNLLWSPYVIRQTIIFLPCDFYLLSFYPSFFYSSPNLSGRRLDVYHTSTHGVALVRI